MFEAIVLAAQQTVCAPREIVAQALGREYGEAQVGAGLADGNIIELWVNAETGTFTLLVTRPDGISCMVGAGDSWISRPPPPQL